MTEVRGAGGGAVARRAGLRAQIGEIPAASAGMTDLFRAGMTDLFRAGVTDLILRGGGGAERTGAGGARGFLPAQE